MQGSGSTDQCAPSCRTRRTHATAAFAASASGSFRVTVPVWKTGASRSKQPRPPSSPCSQERPRRKAAGGMRPWADPSARLYRNSWAL